MTNRKPTKPNPRINDRDAVLTIKRNTVESAYKKVKKDS